MKENLSRNLHTMLFLDIQDSRFMTINEGAELLLEMAAAAGDTIEDRLAVGIARAGSENAVVRADRLAALRDHDFGGPLHILVVPARLHFLEARALVALAGAPPDAVESE